MPKMSSGSEQGSDESICDEARAAEAAHNLEYFQHKYSEIRAAFVEAIDDLNTEDLSVEDLEKEKEETKEVLVNAMGDLVALIEHTMAEFGEEYPYYEEFATLLEDAKDAKSGEAFWIREKM